MPAKKKESPKNIRLTKLYVDGYKGLNQFEIDFSDQSCWLLVGKNGSGKTRIGEILTIFHKIGAGETDLFRLFDFPSGNEVEIKLEGERDGVIFSYEIETVQAEIYKEVFIHNGKIIFHRKRNKIEIQEKKIQKMHFSGRNLAFPSLEEKGFLDVKDFLKRISVLRPVPSQLSGLLRLREIRTVFSYAQESPSTSLWHQHLMKENPEWSEKLREVGEPFSIQEHKDLKLTPMMQQIWPDLEQITSQLFNESYSINFKFKDLENALAYSELSDGERIFFMTALLLAELESLGPRICYWDEPENYLAPSEIAPQISLLKGVFDKVGGQFIAASHNPLTMESFAREQIQVLTTEGHAETPQVKKATDFSSPEGMSFSDAYILELLDER